jgi:hypothetical protein
MRHLLTWALLCATTVSALSQEAKYPVSTIPENLLKKANAVIRVDESSFKILSRSKGIYKEKMVVTILNERGKGFAYEQVGYDKLSKVTVFKGTSYDAQGHVIKRLKPSDVNDQSAFDGFSLYSDNRVKFANLTHGEYPYTVEFETEVEYKFLFFIPGSWLYPNEHVSVEHFSYSLTFPEELKPRYHTSLIPVDPSVTKSKEGLTTVSWTLKDQPSIVFEKYGPSVDKLIPHIDAAPSTFEYDGYEGNQNSWQSYGQWVNTLLKDRHTVSDETRVKILELIAGLKTTEEKAKAIYEYMQSKTRYVSIQMGIGGYQPFEADVVDKTGYGDCKALSNYMVSLLGIAGIKSHYTLIRAGDAAPQINTAFPSAQFNHAVVFVPNGRDTLWLECTSQTNPFGYMGRFTGDRQALAITDDGAKIVSTPRYGMDTNVQSRTAVVDVDAAGNAKAVITTTYSGLQYENYGLDRILDNQYDNQKKWIQENTEIPTFDVLSFKMKNVKTRIPQAIVELNLGLPRLASVSGKRLFLTPNLMNRFTNIPEKLEERKTNVVRRVPFTDTDTVRYHMPEGIYPEFLPEPTKIQSRFGEYESTVSIDAGDVVYIRKIKIYQGEFPPSTYQELIDFYKAINKADNAKLVFLSRT